MRGPSASGRPEGMTENFSDSEPLDAQSTDLPDLEAGEPSEADLVEAAYEEPDPEQDDTLVPTDEVPVDPTDDLEDLLPDSADPLRQPAPGGAYDPGASADNDNLADTPGYAGGDNDPTLDPKSDISSEVDPARVDDPADFVPDED